MQLSLSGEADWMQYFGEQKKDNAQELKTEIDRIDDINQMVYELYRLTEEDIKIIEEK